MTISNDLRKRIIEDVYSNNLVSLSDAILASSIRWKVSKRSIRRWIENRKYNGKILRRKKKEAETKLRCEKT